MRKENKIAVKILDKLYAYCGNIARIEQGCVHNRATERDDYFYSKGAFDAYVYVKELILNEKEKIIGKGDTKK